ncbi:MAG: helix-turn-helix transcriptional regulator [Armatimonadota bacterium]
MSYSEALASLMREVTTKKSQRQLAKESDVSQGTIGNMVMGRIPSRDVALRVAKAADIDEIAMLLACNYDEPDNPVDAIESVIIKYRLTGKLSPEKQEKLMQCIREIVEDADSIPEDEFVN